MNRYAKLVKNTALVSVGSFSSKLLAFLFVPFYTAYLTTSEFGVADMIINSTLLLYQLLTLSVAEAAMRFPLDDNCDRKAVFCVGCSFTLGGCVILGLLVALLDYFGFLANYGTLLIAYFVPYSVFTFLSYYARGVEAVGAYSFCGALSSSLILVLGVFFLAVCGLGLQGFILSYALAFSVSSAALFVSAKLYRFAGRPRGDIAVVARQMLRYSIPLVPNGACWWACSSIALYFLALFSGTSSAGLYSAALKIPSILLAIVGFFMTAWRISSVEDFGSDMSRHFFSSVYRGLTSFGTVLAALLIVCASAIGRVMLSGDFYVAWILIPILVVGALFHSLGDFFGTVYLAAKRTAMMFHSTIVGAVVNIVLSLILIPFFDAVGAVIANMIGYMAIWIMRSVHSSTLLRFDRGRLKESVGYALLVLESVSVMLLPAAIGIVFAVAICVIYGREILALSKELYRKLSRNSQDEE